MIDKNKLKYIAFDADDTLWINETYYVEAENQLCEILREYGNPGRINRALFEIETGNIEYYGYGIKAFILSMIETALRVSDRKISQDKIHSILDIAKIMIEKPVELLDGVENVLRNLKTAGYKLIVATKGDLLDQERKLKKSGIEQYFHHIEIMSEKKEQNYQKLLNHLDIKPEELLMIGNSVKSDVLPVLNLGGNAIHLPFKTTWAHEQVSDEELANINAMKSITEVLDILLEKNN